MHQQALATLQQMNNRQLCALDVNTTEKELNTLLTLYWREVIFILQERLRKLTEV